LWRRWKTTVWDDKAVARATKILWLNQAESLLEAFSARYLQRGGWATRRAMINHILKSRVEYNAYFAHPFAWHWSVQQFQFWLNNTPDLIRCRNSATAHWASSYLHVPGRPPGK
jgi:hypothetical protein